MKKRVGIYIRPEQIQEIKKNAINKNMSMSDFLAMAGTSGYKPKKK